MVPLRVGLAHSQASEATPTPPRLMSPHLGPHPTPKPSPGVQRRNSKYISRNSQEKKALSSRGRGRLRGFLELRRPWGPRRDSADTRPRGCSGLGEPRPALPSF